MSKPHTATFTVLVLAAALAGCGGSTGGTAAQDPGYLAPGDHLLTFSVHTAGQGPVPIAGIKLGFVLPKGVTAATVPGSPRIQDAALTAAPRADVTFQATGSFQAATGAVDLDLLAATRKAWAGAFLTLRITIPQGASLTLASFKALNPGFSHYQVAGVDLTTHTSRDLTPEALTLFALDGSPLCKPFHPE